MQEKQSNLKEEQLSKNLEGIHLQENHAKMVWQNNKSLIVKPLKYEDVVGKLYYVVGGNEVFAVVQINNVKQIDLYEFSSLRDKHRITEQERELWWSGKQRLYAYEFNLINRFEMPQLADIRLKSDEDFIDCINILSGFAERCKEILDNIENYNLKKMETEDLKTDFRIVITMSASKPDDIRFTSLLSSIITELKSREEVLFNTEKMKEPIIIAFNKALEYKKM